MATTSILGFSLPLNYAPVLAVATAAFTFGTLQSFVIGGYFRRKADVKYPLVYVPHEQALKDPAAFTYNNAQRAHANYLENLVPAMGSMLLAGLVYPRFAAGFGLAWVLTRVFYFRAYTLVTASDRPGTHPVPLFWIPQWALHGAAFAGWLGPAWEVVTASLK